jgi:AraC-like DNA-binding protein/predicted enzyme related to lactoylglutathione lyase
MITGVSKVVVPVADQDQATKFWTEVIGFRLLRDEIYAGNRWIEVEPPDRSVVLVLSRRRPNELGREVPNALPHSNVFFSCDDIEQTYAALRGRGVSFPAGPAQMPIGWWSTFQDPEGTRFVLEQREAPSAIDRLIRDATEQLRCDGTSRARSVHGGNLADRLRAGAHSMVFHHPAGQIEKQHHPAWKIVIPNAGQIVWKSGQDPATQAAGVIFPPQLPHTASTAAGYILMFIDPWFLGLGPGHGRAIPLDPSTVEQIRDLWNQDGEDDPDDQVRATVAFLRQREFLPRAVSIDPRVAAALRDLPVADCIQHAATAVALSPSRLRTLIRDQTGTPPAQLRMWQRLRAAIISLQVKPIAVAASDAGFADQAHLTRTATRLVGHTPRGLLYALSSVPREGPVASPRPRHNHGHVELVTMEP